MGSRDDYVSAIKAAYVSISTRLTLAWAVSFFPASWNPIVLKIVKMILEPLLKHIFTYLPFQTELAAFFYYIDTRVGSQSQGFEAAAFENFRIQQTGTKQEKKDAEEKLWKAFEPFARLTG